VKGRENRKAEGGSVTSCCGLFVKSGFEARTLRFFLNSYVTQLPLGWFDD
jgi:hypothetical protein